VIKRAVARDRERRQNSAHTLIRELEDVTLRVEGAEDLHPYPGLASFTEEDAEYFFGREAEVERLWRKLEGPSRLLALVGPSGAGKTSFLQAGLVSHAGSGWQCVISKPGTNPVLGLSRALAPEMAGDVEAMDLLLRFDDPEVALDVVSRWRRGTENTLVVVDQFEELFTQNAADVQQRFADLLSRLVLESDVFVILSMRDDFMMRCRDLEALEPIFSEMTALPALAGGALRRALVRPATKCGYRFENDELVEEILAEVEGERGALPLVAFALARLWEKRDRDSGLLTRQAYHDIGGVGGALARHAEATVDRIGVERIPIVRELFRNLVTAEGTRAVREWDELLSVFEGENVRKLEGEKADRRERFNIQRSGESRCDAPSNSERSERSLSHSSPARAAATEVLRELIDARLLTSYEVREDEHEPIRRVEIIHESLLANWPRLVRWQTQDQEGAQLRDELRQAARAWDEHGRHDDRLWTGTAFREFQLWRERYPGGLTETEEAFAAATTSLATRRKRRRRTATTAGVIMVIAVAAVFANLWNRSVEETLRAEATSLIALGQLELDPYPSSAVAHAIASLEVADTATARQLALKALWKGPTAFIVNEYSSSGLTFSPDGSWLVQLANGAAGHFVHSRDGTQRLVTPNLGNPAVFGEPEDLFFAQERRLEAVSLRSAREGRVLASTSPQMENLPALFHSVAVVGEGSLARAIFAVRDGGRVSVEALTPDGGHEVLGTLTVEPREDGFTGLCIPRITGDWVAVVENHEVSVVGITERGITDRRLLGRQESSFSGFCLADPLGRFFVTTDSAGRIMLWDIDGVQAPTTVDVNDKLILWYFSLSVDGSYLYSPSLSVLGDIWLWSVDGFSLRLLRRLEDLREIANLIVDPVGLRLAMEGPESATRLWSLSAPAEADPTLLRRGPVISHRTPRFSPDGKWLATTDGSGLALWPIARELPIVIRHKKHGSKTYLQLASDGRFILTLENNKVLMVQLDQGIPAEGRIVFEDEEGAALGGLLLAPDERHFAVIDAAGTTWIGDVEGDEPRQAPTDPPGWTAFSLDGRYLARVRAEDGPDSGVVVWDLETGREVASLHLDGVFFSYPLKFTSDGRLLVSVDAGVLSWDPATGEHEILVETEWCPWFHSTDDGRRLVLVVLDPDKLVGGPLGCPVFHDLDTGRVTPLETHGHRVLFQMLLDDEGETVVTADLDGVIRVGPVTGEEPHVLLGHQGNVNSLDMDLHGRWIASTGKDGTVRLWPMPDLTKPPLHTLPREELIAKLKTLTNLRVVRDPESSTGWTLTHDPFPGWETVPTW
jgi:WD40 repeat protein